MNQSTELIQLVETSGLEKTKQNQIAETLGAFFNKAAEWDDTIKSIVITSPEETGKMKMAKEGRLTLKNMRLEAEKIVKSKRDEVKYRMANDVLEDKLWLKAGQMMEATFKNLETKLEEKEKFAERWEAEQKEKLKQSRLAELLPLGFQYENGFDLGNMSEQMYQSLKVGLETAKKEKEEAERKAEEERQHLIKMQQLHEERRSMLLPVWQFEVLLNKDNLSSCSEEEFTKALDLAIEKKKEYELAIENQRKENERLKAEAEAKEKQLAEERAKAEKEREESERILLAERKAAEEKLEAERADARKLAAELEAKKQAEEKARQQAEADKKAQIEAQKKAEKAPRVEKINNWIDSMNVEIPVGLNDDEVVKQIINKFESFKTWAKSLANSIEQ